MLPGKYAGESTSMTNNESLPRIQNTFNFLVSLLKGFFNPPEIEEVQGFIDVGEYEMALETLCFIVQDKKKTISIRIFNYIVELGILMEMDPGTWGSLRNNVR